MSNLNTYIGYSEQLLSESMKQDKSLKILENEIINRFDLINMTNVEKSEMVISLFVEAIAQNITRIGSSTIQALSSDKDLLLFSINEQEELARVELEKASVETMKKEVLLAKEKVNTQEKMLPLEKKKGELTLAEADFINDQTLTIGFESALTEQKSLLLIKEDAFIRNQSLTIQAEADFMEEKNLLAIEEEEFIRNESLTTEIMAELEEKKTLLKEEERKMIAIEDQTRGVQISNVTADENVTKAKILNLEKQILISDVEDDKIVEMQKAELRKEEFAEENKDMYKKKVLTGEQQRDLIRRQSQGYKDNLLAKAAEFRGQVASFAVNVDNNNAQDRINEFNSTIASLKARGNY